MSRERMEVLILGKLFGTASGWTVSGWDEVDDQAVQFYDVVFTEEAKRFLQTQQNEAYTFYYAPMYGVFSVYDEKCNKFVFNVDWSVLNTWPKNADQVTNR